jgi:PEP-CTERM/exosortase A-associated glycosyltransferase
MKVLHILFHSVPVTTGYSLRSKYVLKNIKNNGFAKIIALTSPFQNQTINENKIDYIDGIEYYRINKKKGFIFNNMFYYMLQIIKKLIVINKKEEIDAFHVHSPWIIALPCILVGKILNIPVIYEVRGVWEDTDVALGKKSEKDLKYRLIRKLETWCMKNATQIVAISKKLKEDIISRGIDTSKITHIPNGVDTSVFSKSLISNEQVKSLKDFFGIKENEIVIGYISSIRKLEGIQYLIEAAKYIKQKNIRFKMIIVGDGDYLSSLKIQAKTLGFSNEIIFVGKVNHNEIINYYGLIDIFVVPRIKSKVNELVTPLKPYEALAMGKVLVVSNVGGLKEIITNNKTGVIFESENAEDLSNKICYLIEDNELREKLSRNGEANARHNFEWSVISQKYKGVYRKIMKM